MNAELLASFIEHEMKLGGAADVTLNRQQWQLVLAALRAQGWISVQERAAKWCEAESARLRDAHTGPFKERGAITIDRGNTIVACGALVMAASAFRSLAPAKQPIQSHSKSEYRRMTAQGANVLPPGDKQPDVEGRRFVVVPRAVLQSAIDTLSADGDEHGIAAFLEAALPAVPEKKS